MVLSGCRICGNLTNESEQHEGGRRSSESAVELIGFIKIIYVDRIATVIHILAKNQHQDKRPVNALLAKAVELFEKKDISFLLDGKYVYDKNEETPLTEFKRRNGFEEIKFPRYFLPLSVKERLAIKLALHKGAKGADVWSSAKQVCCGIYDRNSIEV